MTRIRIGMLGALLALVLSVGVAQAFEIVAPATSGNARLEAGKKVDNTVFTAGQDVDIRGDVMKDLFTAGNTVTIAGHVDGNAIAAGETVKVTGVVKGDLIVAGKTVVISAEGHVLGDVLLFGGSAELLGPVDGKVTAYTGQLTLGNKVGGDVQLKADKLVFGSGGAVAGRLKGTLGTTLNAASKAKVAKGVTVTVETTPFSKQDVTQGMKVANVLGIIYKLLSVLATGLILLLLFPKGFEALRAENLATAGLSGLVGLVALVFLPIVFVLSAVFFITLPLGFLAIAFFVVMAMLGTVAANLWVGDLLGRHSWPAFTALVVGILVLTLLQLIPFIGPLMAFTAWLVGLGSVLRLTWQQLSKGRR